MEGKTEAIAVLMNDPRSLVNLEDSAHLCPLHYALLNQKWGTAKMIVCEGDPSPGAVTKVIQKGQTSLHIMSEQGDWESVQATLQISTGSVDLKDLTLKTPLHYGSANGHIEVVKRILDVSTGSVNLQDSSLKTPLHYGSENGHVEVVKKILDISTAGLEIPEAKGLSPWGSATLKKHSAIAELLLKKTSLRSVYRYIKLDILTICFLLLCLLLYVPCVS